MGLSLGLREWGQREFWAGIRGCLGLTSQSADEAFLTHWFSESFASPALLLNSGSSALRLALQTLAARHPERLEVVVPALACPALTRVVLDCGLSPYYADIESDLNLSTSSVAAALTPNTLAVIMVHAFGHPADTAGIQTLCQQKGVALIDDAAQRIDPASRLGRAGDFGIFSFAQSKSLVTGIDGSGGVLLVNSPQNIADLNNQWRSLPMAQGRALAWLEFALSPGAPRTAYYVGRLRKHGAKPSRQATRIGAVDAALAKPQLASLPERLQRRQTLLQVYGLALNEHGVNAPQLIDKTAPEYLARLLVSVDPKRRVACREALAAKGISSRLPYRLPDNIAAFDCPQAQRSANELLELPLPAYYSKTDIYQAASTVAPFSLL